MRARIAAAATGLLAAAVLSACGGSSDDGGTAAASSTGTSSSAGSASSASSSSAAGTSSAVPTAGAVEVEAKDFSLELSTTTFSPGEYTFTMRNDGGATHAIEIEGPGVDDAKSGAVGPGSSSSVTVTLQPGDYTIYCPVGNHRAMGMQTTFTVG